MEGYTKQVEEFQSYGDMSEIQKYLRKAQALDNKLQAAAEKVGNLWDLARENCLNSKDTNLLAQLQ